MSRLKKTKRITSIVLSFVLLLSMCISAPVFAAENAAAADLATLQGYANIFTGNGSSDSRHYVVNGELWTWGENDGWTLGYTEYTDINGKKVTLSSGGSSEKVPVPTKVNPELFDGKIIKVHDGGRSVVAITDKGSLYAWGKQVSEITGKTGSQMAIPTKLTVPTNNVKIVDAVVAQNQQIAAKDANGVWYMGGKNSTYGSLLKGVGDTTVYPFFAIPSTILNSLGKDASNNPRKIKMIMPASTQAPHRTLVLTEDGKLFAFGRGNYIDGVGTTSYITAPYDMTANIASLKGATIKELIPSCESGYCLVDTAGNVYFSSLFGNYCAANNRLPVKVFDASVMKKTPLFVQADYCGFSVICTDNTVWCAGYNYKGQINPLQPNVDQETPVQVAADLSKEKTIVRVLYSAEYINFMTSDGIIYFDGSNVHGGSGAGSTGEDSEHVIGSGPVQVATMVPPIEPLSANQIVFDIETSDGTIYRPAPEPEKGYPNQVVKVLPDGSEFTLNDGIEIPAGQIFKLNVYFNDFDQIHNFVVPIRFDAKTLQVVNGDGIAYPKSTVSPGEISKSVGIQSYVTDEVWKGGKIDAGIDGTYPKIDNQNGWVSVIGHTLEKIAPIEGKQKMFSINFMAMMTDSKTEFAIADENNVPADVTGGPGYDTTGATNYFHGAAYYVTTENSTTDPVSQFPFTYGDFPVFSTKSIGLSSISLKLLRNSDKEVTDRYTDSDYGKGQGYAIDFANTTSIYEIRVIPDPENASFPQVNWTYTCELPDDGVTELQHLIQIVEEKPTYLKFKVSESYPVDKLLSCVKFVATPRDYPSLAQPVNVFIKSFTPPGFVHIAEKLYDSNGENPEKTEFIYHYNDNHEKSKDEVKVYTAQFPEGTTLNTGVTWSLYDSDGIAIDPTDANAPVLIDVVDDDAKTVTISPKKSTGDDYVTLRVESVYDPNIYDTVTIKVQLYITDIEFTQDVVRVPVDTAKDLSTYLRIAPDDYYVSNLVWTHERRSDGGLYINFNGTSNISAGPVATSDGVVERVTVKDTISGESDFIDISVISLTSPLMPDDYVAYNLLGETSDYLDILQNLQEGDIVYLYKDATATKEWYKTPELTNTQVPYLKIPTNGLYYSGGGTIEVAIERVVDGERTKFDRVPVDYAQEPSEVYGYVRLQQKNKFSDRNEGILVELTGAGSTQSTYTTEAGYFKFDQYIPAGTYSITFTRDRYLKRTVTVAIPTKATFMISEDANPILLYPGDYDHNNQINKADVDYYVRNWVGQTSTFLTDFDSFDWYDEEDNSRVINNGDLGMATVHSGWNKAMYPQWKTPKQ